MNQDLNDGRLGGTLAPGLITSGTAYLLSVNDHHQVGNTGTDTGQPGGAANSNTVLLAFNGSFQSVIDIALAATAEDAPITIGFDMYLHGTAGQTGDGTKWGAFTLRSTSAVDGWPVVGGGEFGFLVRRNGGVQMFNGGGNMEPAGWDTAGFALADHWDVTFSDTAGTGSAFDGSGSVVTLVNGAITLGSVTLSQLNGSNLQATFRDYDNQFAGIDNLSITTVTVPEPASAALLSVGLGLLIGRRRRNA